jgi:hypothetical protein
MIITSTVAVVVTDRSEGRQNVAQNNILFVRNLEQQALWLELDGQISDGTWENARPLNHWEVWCKAEVKIAEHPFQLGRTFYAAKQNYDFTNAGLLKVVGKRMLGIVRIARRFGIEVASQLEHDVKCDGSINFPRADTVTTMKWEAEYLAQRLAKFATLATEFGATEQELAFAVVDPTYTMTMMKADLADLKFIVKRYSADVLAISIPTVTEAELKAQQAAADLNNAADADAASW